MLGPEFIPFVGFEFVDGVVPCDPRQFVGPWDVFKRPGICIDVIEGNPHGDVVVAIVIWIEVAVLVPVAFGRFPARQAEVYTHFFADQVVNDLANALVGGEAQERLHMHMGAGPRISTGSGMVDSVVLNPVAAVLIN